MTVLEFTALVWIGSLAAGLLGSLTGLGGGVVLVPLLTLFFHVDIRYAIGASLVSVIATSSGAAAAYVREGFSNIRIGMFLEIATTLGALSGAFLATVVPVRTLATICGAGRFGGALPQASHGSRTASAARCAGNHFTAQRKLPGSAGPAELQRNPGARGI
jgi:uncharacterized membrane protein YfcA